jgi:hypothetical protein
MTQTEFFPEFKLEIVDTFETAKQEIVRYKALYDEMLHHYNRMRVENERLKENERDMLKASTLVTALNENHQLRDEVTLLKRSLKKAMSDLNLVRRPDSSSEEKPLPEEKEEEEKPLPEEKEEEEKPLPEEKEEEEKPLPEEKEEEEKPPSEEDEARCFSPMVFKKTNYFSDEEGNMYEMNADSSVGDLVGTFRVVDGKYKVKMIRK